MNENFGPELPPYRPPSEASSVLVRVTRGCAWNRCTFCGMYKRLRFEVRSLEEIEADLPLLRREWPVARSIFLADSDALTHPKLPQVVEAVRRTFPEAERITSYGRLRTLERKSMETLRSIRAAGLTRIHAGLESGDPDILTRICKGATPEQAITGGRKAIEADFDLSFYILCGIGGETAWKAHAEGSARVTAAVAPHFIRLRSLVLLPGTPLHEQWDQGEFEPVSPLTRLHETRRLVELLAEQDSPRQMELASDHFSNYVWADGELVYGGVNGYLPSDGPLLLKTLDQAIATVESAAQAHDPGSLALRGETGGLFSLAL